MKITYENKEAMTFIGFHTHIRPDEGYQKCPEFWDREYNEKYARLWRTMEPETPVERALLENEIGMYAICADREDGFDYWIAGLYRGGEVPEGLELYSFPAGGWAVFTTKGPMPESLQEMNTCVWREWFPNEGMRRGAGGKASIEAYSAGDPRSPDYESGIWMPIREI
jgi:AraC family transcriptional regulator